MRGWTLGVRPGHPFQTKSGACWGHRDPSSSRPRPRPRRSTRRGTPEDTLAQPTQDSAAAREAAPREWTTRSTAKGGEVGWALQPWLGSQVAFGKQTRMPWRVHISLANSIQMLWGVRERHPPPCLCARQAFLPDDSGGGVERGRGRRGRTLVLGSRPPRRLGAPLRLGVLTDRRSKARGVSVPPCAGSQYLPAPPSSGRPDPAAARRRGGARAGLKSLGAGRGPWSRRSAAYGPGARRWDIGPGAGGPRKPKQLRSAGRGGWGGDACGDAGVGVGAPGRGSAVVPPGQSERRATRGRAERGTAARPSPYQLWWARVLRAVAPSRGCGWGD